MEPVKLGKFLMTVTLNISSQNIKVVVTSGKNIIKWETVPLPPGLIKDRQIREDPGPG